MTPEKVIEILERKIAILGNGFTYLIFLKDTPEEVNEAIEFAIREVGKCIPRKPIRRAWAPNRCPTCEANLGGECDDGFYQNPWYEYCPECRQKLDYD